MGGFVLVPFLILGWMLIVSVSLALAATAIIVVFAAFNWLYRKCFPPKFVPFNPDVIPKVPEPRNLLGG